MKNHERKVDSSAKDSEVNDGMIKQSIVYQTSIEKLKEAKKKRLQRKNTGSNEEYSKVITNEFKELEKLRGRASACQI